MAELSVLFCVRNGGHLMRQSLDSLLSQTFKDFELIAVDDASTDETSSVLEEYKRKDPRVTVIRNAENLGLTRSLIRAFEASRGAFLARQDADDLSHPDRFRRQLEHLKSDAGAGAVACSYNVIDDSGEVLNVRQLPSAFQTKRILRRRNILAHGSLMFRREVFESTGGYRSEFRYAQDYDLLLRLFERSRIAIDASPLYSLRISSNTIGPSRFIQQNYYAELAKQCAAARARQGTDDPVLSDRREPDPSSQDLEVARGVYALNKAVHLLQSGRQKQSRDVLLSLPSTFKRTRYWSLFLLTFLPYICVKPLIRFKWKLESMF